MCGIFGIVNAMNGPKSCFWMSALSSVARDGVLVTSLRGVDGTGVFQVHESKGLFSHKRAIPANEFVREKYGETYFPAVNSSTITVFHCRAATQGAVSDATSHPFIVDVGQRKQLIGVHNGTFHGWRGVKGSELYRVDSEMALATIAGQGDKAFTETLPAGSYSFVWWDERSPNLLNFARNDERPMWIVMSKNRRHMIFASELEAIGLVLARNGLRDKFEEEGFSTAPNCRYALDVSSPELVMKQTTSWEARKQESFFTTWGDDYLSRYRSSGVDRAAGYAVFAKMDKIIREYKELVSEEVPKKENTEGSGKVWPMEAGELGTVALEEMWTTFVTAPEAAEAEDAGLLGEVVVFTGHTKETGDNTIFKGTVLCALESRSYDLDNPAHVDAFLPWPIAGGVNMTPKFRKFAAIAGIRYENDKPVFILSPLKTAAAMTLRPKLTEWARKNAPDVAIGT